MMVIATAPWRSSRNNPVKNIDPPLPEGNIAPMQKNASHKVRPAVTQVRVCAATDVTTGTVAACKGVSIAFQIVTKIVRGTASLTGGSASCCNPAAAPATGSCARAGVTISAITIRPVHRSSLRIGSPNDVRQHLAAKRIAAIRGIGMYATSARHHFSVACRSAGWVA